MGKVLAYISIFYGMSGVDLSLEPVFGENIKEGSIFLKGNMYIFSACDSVRVYRNEQFKRVYFQIEKSAVDSFVVVCLTLAIRN
ncbi:MAG: hypothetical protein ACLR7D_10620 [Lachnospira eligens]